MVTSAELSMHDHQGDGPPPALTTVIASMSSRRRRSLKIFR